MRTLDGCKDVMFEARAMFEVIEEVLDTRTLDVTLEMRMLDAQELIANLGLLTNGVLTKDGVDGCKGISSRMRVIIIRRKRDNVDRSNGVASRMKITVTDLRRKNNIIHGVANRMIASGVRMRMLDA